MEFWASSETYRFASDPSEIVRNLVEPYLNTAFAAGSLSELILELRYIPIIMPVEMHIKYTERTKLRAKARISVVAPHLDYALFVEGTLADQLADYLRGVAFARPHLKKLGATDVQLADFDRIISTAKDRIMQSRAD
jgi:hypothetical protein